MVRFAVRLVSWPDVVLIPAAFSVLVAVLVLAGCSWPWQTQQNQTTTFSSDTLGISFTYGSRIGADTLSTKVVGNTVYLYNSNDPYTGGQSVQVLTKDAHDSLNQAITKLVLKGYPEGKCVIGTARGGLTTGSFKTASIYYQSYLSGEGGEGLGVADPQDCPQSYTVSPDGGEEYFLMDTNHPTKLLFFRLGTYTLPASGDLKSSASWQDTITIH